MACAQIDGEIRFNDIVPVMTPALIAVWLLILGTAHQLIIRQYMENYRMAKLQATLNSHIIAYGFRHNGMSAAKGLLARGAYATQIVVINKQEERVWSAGTLDIPAL